LAANGLREPQDGGEGYYRETNQEDGLVNKDSQALNNRGEKESAPEDEVDTHNGCEHDQAVKIAIEMRDHHDVRRCQEDSKREK
jgi:hypothetical protein